MFHIALLEPEIAGNAGNIARTCLATGSRLHLIRPLGFRLDEASLKRAGMDYWSEVDVSLHDSYAKFSESFKMAFEGRRVFSFSTKATKSYSDIQYKAGDVLLFGPESRGLSESIRQQTTQVRIPMTQETRSLNVSVSVSIAVYEAWRQQGWQVSSVTT
jgi:tRNA (cytidine/uridine-2'-O-)-methyltransferase